MIKLRSPADGRHVKGKRAPQGPLQGTPAERAGAVLPVVTRVSFSFFFRVPGPLAPPATAPPAVPSVLPSVSTEPATPPIAAPAAVALSARDMFEQAPRPEAMATTSALTDRVLMVLFTSASPKQHCSFERRPRGT